MENPVVPEEDPDKYNDMPEGLSGYWWETSHLICIPVVISEVEGSGVFSKWLDELGSKGKVVFFPTIISAKLNAILRSRGYVDAYSKMSELEYKIYKQEYCDGLALFPKRRTGNTRETTPLK